MPASPCPALPLVKTCRSIGCSTSPRARGGQRRPGNRRSSPHQSARSRCRGQAKGSANSPDRAPVSTLCTAAGRARMRFARANRFWLQSHDSCLQRGTRPASVLVEQLPGKSQRPHQSLLLFMPRPSSMRYRRSGRPLETRSRTCWCRVQGEGRKVRGDRGVDWRSRGKVGEVQAGRRLRRKRGPEWQRAQAAFCVAQAWSQNNAGAAACPHHLCRLDPRPGVEEHRGAHLALLGRQQAPRARPGAASWSLPHRHAPCQHRPRPQRASPPPPGVLYPVQLECEQLDNTGLTCSDSHASLSPCGSTAFSASAIGSSRML